jgi:hypothetical protein
MILHSKDAGQEYSCPNCGHTDHVPAPDEYQFDDPSHRQCPKCKVELDPDAVICLKCGYNRKTGRRVKRQVEPISHEWSAGLALYERLILLGVLVCLIFFISCGIGFRARSIPALLLIMVVAAISAVVSALMVGTYFHVSLGRNKRGEIRLSKTWRIAFFPIDKRAINVRSDDQLLLDFQRGFGPLGLAFTLVLICFGIFPGLIWLFLAFQKETYVIELRDAGRKNSVVIFQGWSQVKMTWVAERMKEVANLRLERK